MSTKVAPKKIEWMKSYSDLVIVLKPKEDKLIP